VHLAKAYEFGPLKAREASKNPLLFAELEPGLKANQPVKGANFIFLAQLHCGKRRFTGAGVGETNGPEGAKSQGFFSRGGNLLDWLAAREQSRLVKIGDFQLFGCE
jgi:hypothetical protein